MSMRSSRYPRASVLRSNPSAKPKALGRATRSVIELLEGRQLLSGTIGVVAGLPGPSADDVTAVVRQGSKVIVAGRNLFSQDGDAVLARLNADGTLDATFGADGRVTVNFGGLDTINALAIDGNNRIVAVGGSQDFDTGASDMVVARFNDDGTLDATGFDGDGIQMIPFASDPIAPGAVTVATATAVAIDAAGNIAVAGTSQSFDLSQFASGPESFAVSRVNANGSLDLAFGSQVTAIGDGDAIPHAVAFDLGSLIVGGQSTFPGDSPLQPSFTLARYDSSGGLVQSFGANDLDGKNGVVVTPFTDQFNSRINSKVLALAVNGGTVTAIGTAFGVGVARYDKFTGLADLSFHSGTPFHDDNFSSFNVVGGGIANGQLYVTGVVDVDPGVGVVTEIGAVRYNFAGPANATTLLRDLTYGAGGVVSTGVVPTGSDFATVDDQGGVAGAATTTLPDFSTDATVGSAGSPGFTVTVDFGENKPPTLDPIGSLSVNETAPLTFTAAGHDVDAGDTLTYSLIGAPAGATINAGSGAFSWTPAESQDGVYTFTVRVTDSGSPNLSADRSVSVAVAEVNAAPSLADPGSKSVNEGSPLSFTLAGSDPDTGPGAANQLTYSILSGAQGGMSLVGGVFSWTPGELQDGTYTVTFGVADNGSPSLAASRTITITVGEVNQAPTLNPIATPQAVNEGATIGFTASGLDADFVGGVANTLTYSLVGAPAGASVNPTTGAFTWTPTETQDGSYTFNVRVTDNGAGSLSAQQSITIVVGEVNAAPTLANPGNKNVNEGSNLSFTLVGSDTDAGPGAANQLTYSILSGALPGMSLNANSGAFSWTPAEAQDGVYTVTFRVADNGTPNLADTRTITITVGEVNQAPTLDPIPAQNGTVGTPVTFTATGHDTDIVAGQPNTLTYTLTGSVPAGATINPSTGAFSWTPAAAGAYSFAVQVSDGAGGIASQPVVVTVTPVVVTGPTASVIGGVLTVVGTGGANTLSVQLNGAGNYVVQLDGQPSLVFPAGAVSSVLVQGGDGLDVITVAANVNVPTELHGGGGTDIITGGSGDDLILGEGGADVLIGRNGNDVFVGGDDADILTGGNGRDVLIGGLGGDVITGDNGDDILIAGATAHDASPANLIAIRNIWTGGGDYTTRVNALKSNLLKSANIFNDTSIDLLSGNNGRDWIIANAAGSGVLDLLLGLQGNEILTEL